jgi:spore coat polysaccharide biosynthesis predicted glycosyltransferase SpsG
MLLRQEFEFMRALSKPRTKLGSIFVSLGGTDPYNVTDLVLEGIRKTRLDIPVTVVVSANSPHLLDVKDKVKSMSNVIAMTIVHSMAALMVNADLAIGAGGTTAWERCSLGLPSLVLEVADNQRDVIRRLVLADAALECPIDDYAIYEAIMLLNSSPEILTQMSFSASAICPGNGAHRVAQILLDTQQG